MEDRRHGQDRNPDPDGKRQHVSPTLIDFGKPVPPGFQFQRRSFIRHGDVSVVCCILLPNPGMALGASQFTVAIHQGQPFDMEWRLPESRMIARQRILTGQAHINGPDRPIFQRWSASPAILVIALEPEFVRQIKGGISGREDVWLETRIGVADPVLESIGSIWSCELVEIRTGGRLFAESLGALLTLHLFRTCCNRVPRPDWIAGGLDPGRQRKVLDYMEAHLGEDISLKELAAIADLSVHHFGAAFRATMGLPPHRFLMERRVQRGEARPTASDKPREKRGRRRPDPLIEVTGQLKRWFEEEPWRSGRELLDKLQAERPGDYPDSLLRAVQRGLKIWRSEQARALVFTGSSTVSAAAGVPVGPAMAAG